MPRRAGRLTAYWLAATALAGAVLASVVLAQDDAPPGTASTKEALAASLAEAESHLAAGEPQLAESVYRDVNREAWHLLGLLAVAEGDLPTARDALERSTLAAAVGVLAPRLDLALVQHRLGETADAQQRLRALSREFRFEEHVWRALIATLAADGRRDEAEEQLGEMRIVIPELAVELEAEVARLERPEIDLGRLGESTELRDELHRSATAAIEKAGLGLMEARKRAEKAPDLEALLDDAASEALAPAIQAIRSGQPREAESLLRRAQKQGHDSPAVSRLLALARAASGDSVRTRLELARVAGGEGAAKAALALLAEARQRAPSCEDVLAAEARLAMTAGLDALALRALEPLAGMFPEVAEYAYLLGTALARLGAMTDAVSALERSVELAPAEASYRLALAEALNIEKRYDEAEAHLTQILAADPENVAAAAAMALAEEGQGKLEAAEKHARDVLERQPDHAVAHMVLGMVRMKQERYAEARDALEQALAADPGATKVHYQLSLAFMRLGDPENARRHQELYNAAQASSEGETTLLHLESSTEPGGEEHRR